MSLFERVINKLIISIIFSIFNWIIINHFIVEIPFWQYFILEMLLIVSLKFYIFTIQKLQL